MDEKEFKKARELMVERQLVPRGIKDKRVLGAMRDVSRHEFVLPKFRGRAYDDGALPIADGQTISQPFIVALMTELLELTGTETVLEVGTGSGYQSAVLSLLARRVYTVDRIASLTETAREKLSLLGYDNVTCLMGDGSAGLPEHAPFDRIIVTAGAPGLPEPLTHQLAEGGIIVIPEGTETAQSLKRYRIKEGKLTSEFHSPCVFVPLIGEHAWEQDNRFRGF